MSKPGAADEDRETRRRNQALGHGFAPGWEQ